MAGDGRRLLIVEDDPGLQSALRWSFDDGIEVATAEDRGAAIAQLRRVEPQVVTLDLGLPPDAGSATEGLATLAEILDLAPQTKVIVLTGNTETDAAKEAVARGAWLFCQKPVDPEFLNFVAERAFRLHELELENRRLSLGAGEQLLDGVVGSSPPMQELARRLKKVAPTEATVLVLGESGTGKELIARNLHQRSARSKGPWVAINCAAIPDTLIESELFGYEKGAFTGATKQTRGNIEYAHGGTLFLDEIGDLPLPLQSKLLRFLQERTITRLGGRQEIPVDVRVVCATHQDLARLIADGGFREDLYYRIGEFSLRIPALRERNGDVIELAEHLVARFAEQLKKSRPGLSREALAALEAHDWPGNVRELENRIKRAVILADGQRITPEDLELATPAQEPEPLNLRQIRERAESEALIRAYRQAKGNVSQAATLLGITRPTFYALVKKYQLKI